MKTYYYASHAHFGPTALHDLAVAADRASFDGIQCRDRIAAATQGAASGAITGAAWSWAPAAMALTRIPFSITASAGLRHSRVELAQAIGTCAALFPGRLDVALEARAEHDGPLTDEERARLRGDVEGISRLMLGSDEEGTRLRPAPPVPPRLSVHVDSAADAAWAGSWWPALSTSSNTIADADVRLRAFRDALGAAGDVTLEVHFSTEFPRPASVRRPGHAIATADALEALIAVHADLAPAVLALRDVNPLQGVIGLYRELRGV